jgi:DNA-binding CsgD family transcriptional regulator
MLGSYRRAYYEHPAKERDESRRYQLTPREVEVLGLLCQRLTSREIGARLGIRRESVDAHIGNIIGKFGAHDRVEALAIAIKLGLMEPTKACPASSGRSVPNSKRDDSGYV